MITLFFIFLLISAIDNRSNAVKTYFAELFNVTNFALKIIQSHIDILWMVLEHEKNEVKYLLEKKKYIFLMNHHAVLPCKIIAMRNHEKVFYLSGGSPLDHPRPRSFTLKKPTLILIFNKQK